MKEEMGEAAERPELRRRGTVEVWGRRRGGLRVRGELG